MDCVQSLVQYHTGVISQLYQYINVSLPAYDPLIWPDVPKFCYATNVGCAEIVLKKSVVVSARQDIGNAFQIPCSGETRFRKTSRARMPFYNLCSEVSMADFFNMA